jgi:hypothetical protein
MFLTGVFLGPANPGAAPSTIDYTTLSSNALSFNPLLGQVFFIGDGLGTGSIVQQFFVPSGATRLFFGFADGIPGLDLRARRCRRARIRTIPAPLPWITAMLLSQNRSPSYWWGRASRRWRCFAGLWPEPERSRRLRFHGDFCPPRRIH